MLTTSARLTKTEQHERVYISLCRSRIESDADRKMTEKGQTECVKVLIHTVSAIVSGNETANDLSLCFASLTKMNAKILPKIV